MSVLFLADVFASSSLPTGGNIVQLGTSGPWPLSQQVSWGLESKFWPVEEFTSIRREWGLAHGAEPKPFLPAWRMMDPHTGAVLDVYKTQLRFLAALRPGWWISSRRS